MASRWTPWANPLLAYWKHGCDNPTKAEASIEPSLAALGERYRHQYPFWSLKYFADFALLDRKLIIEVDGDSHDTPEQKEKDLQHSLEVLKLGWITVRTTNEMAIKDPAWAVEVALADWEDFRHRADLEAQWTAALARLHQDYPHLLAAAAKKATRRSQSAKAGAALRRKRAALAPARPSQRPKVQATPPPARRKRAVVATAL